MRVLLNTLGLAVLIIAPAGARDLNVAEVTPQGVACVFAKTCAVTPTDSYGVVKLFGDGGAGRLLTRTYPGLPGTPAAGLTGYSLQLDMSDTTALGTANCVEKLSVDTGPLVSLPYAGRTNADIFTVKEPGALAPSSVKQSGGRVTFSFAKPICPQSSGYGRSGPLRSVYFGFAARGAPIPAKAQVTGSMEGTTADVRVPKH